MQTGYLEYNHGKIYYQLSGEGYPLVFLHGFSLDQTMWDAQAKFFSKHFQVLTYDLRGFGRSSIPEQTYRHHEDLAELLQFLQIRRAHIVGLSFGGEIAIDFALTYPEMISKLVLADSSLGGYHSTVDWNVHAFEEGIEQTKLNWLSHPLFAKSNQNEVVRNKLVEIVNNFSGWYWLHPEPDLRERLEPSALSQLEKIAVLTQIIVGDHDLDYFQSIAETLELKIPNSNFEKFADTGHMVNLEQPEKFNNILFEFFH